MGFTLYCSQSFKNRILKLRKSGFLFKNHPKYTVTGSTQIRQGHMKNYLKIKRGRFETASFYIP